MKNMKLVLLAGQSNMSGRDVAAAEDLTEIPGLIYLSKDLKWRPAVEPITKDRPFVGTFRADGTRCSSPDPWDNILPGDGEIVCGVGPGRTFGRLLLESCPDGTVGLIPASVGGTPLRSWKPGGADIWDENSYPYDNAIALTREAISQGGELAAVLWHQGEADASENNPRYKAELMEIIRNFRRDLNAPEVPFILGELGTFLEFAEAAEKVNRIMAEVAAEMPFTGLVSSEGLTHRGDNLHFNTESAHELGHRYFTEYRKMKGIV